MNVSLTKPLERYVHDLVRSGKYSSASEVVRDALRTHAVAGQERESIAALRASIASARQDAKQGQFLTLDEVASVLRAHVRRPRTPKARSKVA
jgi:antitoxin ParD1/3/4